jgi:hypothetical protein
MYEVQPTEMSGYTSKLYLVLSTSFPSNVIEPINTTPELDNWCYRYRTPILRNHSGGFVSQKWRSL